MWQSNFAEHLAPSITQAPVFVQNPRGGVSERRFQVYRNNVYSSLVNNLKDGYPVVFKLVGEAFFKGMASGFVARHLPTSPVMTFYGETFGAFIDQFKPAAGVPFLGDVARLEYARRIALHAADVRPLNPRLIHEMPVDELLDRSLILHPSVQVVESPYPIYSIWLAHMSDEPVGRLTDCAESLLVRRLADQVEEVELPPGGSHFLKLVQLGHTLKDASMWMVDAGREAHLEKIMKICLESAGSMRPISSPERLM